MGMAELQVAIVAPQISGKIGGCEPPTTSVQRGIYSRHRQIRFLVAMDNAKETILNRGRPRIKTAQKRPAEALKPLSTSMRRRKGRRQTPRWRRLDLQAPKEPRVRTSRDQSPEDGGSFRLSDGYVTTPTDAGRRLAGAGTQKPRTASTSVFATNHSGGANRALHGISRRGSYRYVDRRGIPTRSTHPDTALPCASQLLAQKSDPVSGADLRRACHHRRPRRIRFLHRGTRHSPPSQTGLLIYEQARKPWACDSSGWTAAGGTG